jgi:hypothetical protein
MKKIIAVVAVLIISSSAFAKSPPNTGNDTCSNSTELRCGVKKGGVRW